MVNTMTHPELNRTEKQMIEDCLLFGKLAEDNSNIPNLGVDYGKSVSLARMEGPEKVVFYIELLSEEPELLRNKLGKKRDEVYISFDVNNKRYLERTGYFESENKIDFLRNHFKDQRILFKPVLNYDHTKEMYHYNFQIVLVERMDSKEEGSKKYVPIPIISNSLTTGRFERRLIDGKPIELHHYNHAFEIPEFVICSDYIYHIPDESVFKKNKMNDHVYYCQKPEDIKRIPKPTNFENILKMMHQEIAFTSNETRMEWIDLANNEGVPIPEVIELKDNSTKSKKASNKKQTYGNKQDTEKQEYLPEYAFIHRLDYLARKKRLRYSPDDLYNVHTSLKTSNFTILGGMSGTGKTQLALLYAEALKMVEGDNLLFIPVQPSYTEPSDLLGFFNQQSGVYLESEVGLVSFLQKAKDNPDKMHMVLFDEMNLGQVEHYFSDFISLLEVEGEKKLRLFSPNTNCVQPHLKDGITIGNNVLFVGTANFDETTRDFSNRMLDRSNVIILEKLSFMEAQKSEQEAIDNIDDYINQEKNDIHNPDKEISASNYNSWLRGQKRLSTLSQDEISILDQLHEDISNFDSQTGVSFRIAKQISYYLENIPKDESEEDFLSRKTAFDYQIKQRILSKIRGHREQIGSLVGRYENNEYIDGRLSIILGSRENLNNYSNSIAYLEQKAKELMRNGYTL